MEQITETMMPTQQKTFVKSLMEELTLPNIPPSLGAEATAGSGSFLGSTGFEKSLVKAGGALFIMNFFTEYLTTGSGIWI